MDSFVNEFIPSEDMKKCIRDTGNIFTDFEKAAIIYHSHCLWEKKTAELCRIRDSTIDGTLKKQLSERIAYDEKCMEIYASKTRGYVYVLLFRNEERTEIYGCYADPDLAYGGGMKEEPFRIEKYRLIGWESTETEELQDTECSDTDSGTGQDKSFESNESYESAVARLSFDGKGRLLAFESWENEQEDPGEYSGIGDSRISRFENAYVQFPNPFNRGDIVRTVNETEDLQNADNCNVGIVATTQEQWQTHHWPMEWYDYSDVNIIVNFPEESGFRHEHWNPLFLEKCSMPEGEESESLLALKEVMLREEWGEYSVFQEKEKSEDIYVKRKKRGNRN